MRGHYPRSRHRSRRKKRLLSLVSFSVFCLVLVSMVLWPVVGALLRTTSNALWETARESASGFLGDWMPSLKSDVRPSVAVAFKEVLFLPSTRALDVSQWSLVFPEDLVEDIQDMTAEAQTVASGSSAGEESSEKRNQAQHRLQFQYSSENLEPLITLGGYQLNFQSVAQSRESGLWRVRAFGSPLKSQEPVPESSPTGNESEGQLFGELLEWEAIVLSPGDSVLLSPGEADSHAFWNELGALDVVCLGATPDRLDAAGKLLVRSFFTDPEGGENELANTSSLNVSHREEMTTLPLSFGLKRPMDGVIVTWDASSSGRLLILGTRKEAGNRQVLEKPDYEQKRAPTSRLVVTTDQIVDPSRFLAGFRDSLESRMGVHATEEPRVWPEHPDSLENEWRSLQSLSEGILRESPSWHRIEIVSRVEGGSREEASRLFESRLLSSFGFRSRHVLAASFFDDRQRAEELLSTWASAMSAQLPFEIRGQAASQEDPVRDSLLSKRIEEVVSEPSRVRLSTLRSLSIFSTEADWAGSHLDFLTRMLDDVLTKLSSRLVTADFEALIQAMRVTGAPANRDVDLDDRVPEGFRPGWGLSLRTAAEESDELPASGSSSFGLSQSDWYRLFFKETPSQAKGQAKRGAADEPTLVAKSEGPEGKLYVFPSGWAFLPTGSDSMEKSSLSEPVFGLPLRDLSRAKRTIFALESRSKRKLLEFKISAGGRGADKGDRGPFLLDLRSEDPVYGCSSSDPSVRFRRTFSRVNGWMFVKAERDRESTGHGAKASEPVHLACLVDLGSRNPVPKKPSTESSDSDEAGKNISLTVRLSRGNRRVPLSRMRLGPYFEPASLVMSARAVASESLRIDLRKDALRLTRIVPDGADLPDESDLDLWVSASESLPESHSESVRWDDDVEDFLERRLEFSKTMRESRF